MYHRIVIQTGENHTAALCLRESIGTPDHLISPIGTSHTWAIDNGEVTSRTREKRRDLGDKGGTVTYDCCYLKGRYRRHVTKPRKSSGSVTKYEMMTKILLVYDDVNLDYCEARR